MSKKPHFDDPTELALAEEIEKIVTAIKRIAFEKAKVHSKSKKDIIHVPEQYVMDALDFILKDGTPRPWWDVFARNTLPSIAVGLGLTFIAAGYDKSNLLYCFAGLALFIVTITYQAVWERSKK